MHEDISYEDGVAGAECVFDVVSYCGFVVCIYWNEFVIFFFTTDEEDVLYREQD